MLELALRESPGKQGRDRQRDRLLEQALWRGSGTYCKVYPMRYRLLCPLDAACACLAL